MRRLPQCTHLFPYLSNISTSLVMYQEPMLRLRYETNPGIVAYPSKKSASLGMVSGGRSFAASASMFRIPDQRYDILILFLSLPTTYVVRRKVMFSQVSVILFGWGWRHSPFHPWSGRWESHAPTIPLPRRKD